MWFWVVGILSKIVQVNFVWDTPLSFSWNTEGRDLQWKNWYLGNGHSNILTAHRLESLQNNKEIWDLKNNNVKLQNVNRLQQLKRLPLKLAKKITLKKDDIPKYAKTPIHLKIQWARNMRISMPDENQEQK